MTFRIGALLCLSGLAACSHDNTPPAQSAYDTTAPSNASNGDTMTPASLEPSRSTADGPAPAPGSATATDATTPPRQNAPATTTGTTTERVDPAAPPPAAAPANPGVPPDNTKVNERDRNTNNLTPGDQGQNETDLKITQQIRQAVMADDTLSFTAKNVKIITQGGKVTLRGPVKTDAERRAIEAAAHKVAGATQVNNQIEVKK